MNDRINKTSICSIVFLDIIDYSKKSVAEQIEVKNQFNDLINRSLKGVAQNDRIILDTGDGVAIAHMGSPEDAMFVALTIRDGILKSNLYSQTPLYVRFGINLGPVRIVSDINGQPNIIGDGINVAQRIMSFAQANQILVSRSYYEVTSRLTLEFSEMFDYSGVKHDKHVREHEVYSVRSHKDAVANASQPITSNDDRRLIPRLGSKLALPKLEIPKLAMPNKVYLKYAALALPALVAFSLLIKTSLDSSAPTINLEQAPIAVIPSAVAANIVKPNNTLLLQNETVENTALLTTNTTKVGIDNLTVLTLEKELQEKSTQQDSINTKLVINKLGKKEAKKKAKQKEMNEMPPELLQTQLAASSTTVNKPKEIAAKPITSNIKTVEIVADKNNTKHKSGWATFTDSVKQGQESICSQAQISMNQCH